MKKWKLQEAKEHFEEIVVLAENGKPQLVSDKKRGKMIYIVSAEDYKPGKKEKLSFEEFLLSIPKSNDDEDLFTRSVSKPREDINL